MATYRNKSAAAHVDGGKVHSPGATFNAEATANRQKLVDAGVLVLVDAGGGTQESTDKAALVARAKELGVPNAGANWGEEKLKQAIAEAEKLAGAVQD
jgi:hypothetical protein